MKEHLWEMHLHTAQSSRCGHSDAAEMVAAYRDRGFEGIVVTDHFVNANCHAPKNAPWRERIDVLFKGYRAARDAGEACGLRVLPGWEYYFQGGDYLTYGLDESFVYDQSDLCDIDIAEYARRVRAAGGFVAQAHPFRKAWYLPEHVATPWEALDGVEVYNGSHALADHEWNDRALAQALAHSLVQLAGSDTHHVSTVATGVMDFSSPIRDGAELVSALRRGEGRILRNRVE